MNVAFLFVPCVRGFSLWHMLKQCYSLKNVPMHEFLIEGNTRVLCRCVALEMYVLNSRLQIHPSVLSVQFVPRLFQ